MPDTLKVYGPPGTGKTTTGVAWVVDQVRQGHDPEGVAYVSFTKAAAGEAKGRVLEQLNRAGLDLYDLDLPYCGTIHALALRALRIEGRNWLAEAKLREFAESYDYALRRSVRVDSEDEDEVAKAGGEDAILLAVWDFARHRLINDPDAAYQAYTEYDPETAFRIPYDRFVQFVHDYEAWKQMSFRRDYTDLLREAVKKQASLPVSVVAVDEAQDQTPLLWAAADTLFRDADKRACLGDSDQCQPPGTLVLTITGYVPIEELDPEQHRLISYDRQASIVCGFQKGYGFRKSVRSYEGSLYRVSAGDASSLCTPNHKWLVKWTNEAKDPKTCVVYLMQQGDRFRVGWCQLFRSDGNFHLGIRARLEKADAAWILRVCYDRTEASAWESIIATRWGLPTIPFEPPCGTTHLTRDAIDFVFGELERDGIGQQAEECLRFYRRDLQFPIWGKVGEYERRGRSTIGVVETCNLLPELMAVPVHQGSSRVIWEPLQRELTSYNGPVYSLEVDKFQVYLADGLVTHNSIYSFQGCQPELLYGREAEETIELNHSHRLPRAVWELARRVIRQNEGRTDVEYGPCGKEDIEQRRGRPAGPATAEELKGETRRISSLSDLNLRDGSTWMLLVRNWSFVGQIAEELEQAGIPYRVSGENYYCPWSEKGPLKAARAVHALSSPGGQIGMSALREVLDKTRTQTSSIPGAWVYGRKSALLDLTEQEPGRLVGLCDLPQLGLTSWGFDRIALRDLSVLGGMSQRDRDAYANAQKVGAWGENPRVVVSTIHGVKGGEADRVVALESCSGAPLRNLERPDRREEEIRLAYVAITRARFGFYVLEHQGGAGYPYDVFGL